MLPSFFFEDPTLAGLLTHGIIAYYTLRHAGEKLRRCDPLWPRPWDLWGQSIYTNPTFRRQLKVGHFALTFAGCYYIDPSWALGALAVWLAHALIVRVLVFLGWPGIDPPGPGPVGQGALVYLEDDEDDSENRTRW